MILFLILGKIWKARKFYFSFDETLITSVKEFKPALMLLFGSYFTMNVKYSPLVGNTLDFIQR